MRVVRSTLVMTVLVAVTLAIVPAIGSAATVVPALESLREAIGITSQGGQPTLIITGQVPASTPLPVTIVIPFPNGINPDWVGEIAGGDPSKDPTATFSITRGPKFSTMAITLKRSRIGQAEFSVQAPVTDGGTPYSVDLPILGKVGEASLEFRVPSGSKVASISPGVKLQATSGGIDVYSITKKSPGKGSSFSAGLVSQAAGAGSAPVGSTVTDPPSDLGGILVIALAALAGFIGVYSYQSMKDKRAKTAASETVVAERPEPSAPKQPAPSGKAAKRAARRSKHAAAPDAPLRPEGSGAGAAFDDEDPEPEPEPEIVAEDESEDEVDVDENEFDEDEDDEDDELAAVTGGAIGPRGSATTASAAAAGDIVGQLKELVALKTAGMLDMDEFTAAKRTLLAGETRVVLLLEELSRFKEQELLTSEEFDLAKGQLLTGSAEMILGIEDLAAMEGQGLLSREEFRSIVDRLLDA